MGARIQPNSPTDNPDDVSWQTFNAFAYATGDIVIGTNPVVQPGRHVAAVEEALEQMWSIFFTLNDIIPW